MQSIPYELYWPSGNPTALTEVAGLTPAERAETAAKIMAADPDVEQVGFVDATRCRLDMMGGEFCLNATRSLAVFLLQRGLLREHEAGVFTGRVSVSGATDLLEVQVKSVGEEWIAAVTLPFENVPSIVALDPGVVLVDLPGIAHLVLDGNRFGPAFGKEAAHQSLQRFHLLDREAAGCINLTESGGLKKIAPYVHVAQTGTIVAETACGSGTLAAYFACCSGMLHFGSEERMLFRQPSGGFISVEPGCSSESRLRVCVGRDPACRTKYLGCRVFSEK